MPRKEAASFALFGPIASTSKSSSVFGVKSCGVSTSASNRPSFGLLNVIAGKAPCVRQCAWNDHAGGRPAANESSPSQLSLTCFDGPPGTSFTGCRLTMRMTVGTGKSTGLGLGGGRWAC